MRPPLSALLAVPRTSNGVTSNGVGGSAAATSVPLRLDPLPPPPSPVVLVPPPRAEATSSLLDELEAFNADATRQLERPAAVDAALQDALAAAEATREIPAQRNVKPRPATVTGITAPPRDVARDPFAPVATDADHPQTLAPTTVVPKLALMPELAEQQKEKRPPPIPSRRTPVRGVAAPKPIVVPLDDGEPALLAPTTPTTPTATAAPAPALSAPTPKVMQVLGEEATIPGLPPLSSTSGKVITRAELYKLQLEFEDTPARPLPALASLLPLPVLAPTLSPDAPVAPAATAPLVDADAARLGGVESTDLNRLEELEGIEDLDALAQAMGLRSYHEISIPDGEPVAAEAAEAEEVGDDDILDEQPRMTSDVRRARVHAALGDGREDVFLDDEKTIEGLPVIVSRPPLPARAAKPVIVKIPARPKVSLEARNQARKLYLTAVDELAKGDKVAAIGHLKLAIHYDDGVPLYQDFLKHLTKNGDPGATNPRRRRRQTFSASNVRG